MVMQRCEDGSRGPCASAVAAEYLNNELAVFGEDLLRCWSTRFVVLIVNNQVPLPMLQ